MRICSPQLGLAPNSILGGEVFDREILLGLSKRGFEIEIILPKNKPYDKNIKNWHITHLPAKHFPAILANFLYLPYLLRIYQDRPFSILRLHQPQFLALPCILLKLIHKNVKLVATYHQFRESQFLLFSKLINNLWDHIICDSQNVKNQITKNYSVPSFKITVVHNGVPNYLKPQKKNRKLIKKLKLENKIALLFMGLFIERKNPLFLLKVLWKLKATNPNICAVFWGDGPLKTKIREIARKYDIKDDVRIIRPRFGREKNKIHSLADIFVHPSQDEGFSLAPLEAMACAKPVVITDGYSAAEAVEDGVSGFLCRATDTNEWAKKIQDLIDNPKLRERMGQASRMLVKREFQWKFAIAKHIEVFRRLKDVNS